jgi:hypothetical protein
MKEKFQPYKYYSLMDVNQPRRTFGLVMVVLLQIRSHFKKYLMILKEIDKRSIRFY